MKTIFTRTTTRLIAVFSLFTLLGSAQSWQWAKRQGTSGDNDPFTNNGDERVNDIKVDKAGNIYAVSLLFANPCFNDNQLFGATTPPGFGGADAYLVKYNSCGNTLWTRRMGTNDGDEATSLVLDKNGQVVVALYCTGTNPASFGDGVHDTTIIATVGLGYIARFDTAGNFISAANYPFIPGKLLITSQGDYLLTEGELSAVKMTTAGVITNTYTYVTPTPFWPTISEIVLDRNDNVYMCGFFGDTINIGQGTILPPTTSTFVSNSNANNSLIMKFSPSGNLIWYKRGNSGVSDGLYGCTLDTSGTRIATGGEAWDSSTVFNYFVDGGGYNVGSVANPIFILDASNGNLISAITGSPSWGGAMAPHLTDRDNNFICGGNINGYLAFNTTSYTSAGASGDAQNCIGKLDANGSFIDIHLMPQMGSSYGSNVIYSMAMSEQGNIYLAGCFSGTADSAGTAVSMVGGNEDGFVAKYGFACNSRSTAISPLPPTSLTAVYQPTLTNKVSWIDNSQFETGFELWVMGGTAPSYSLLATLAANTTTYTHVNLQHSTTYCYKVRAIDGTGPSVFTNIGCATTPSLASGVGIETISALDDFNLFPNPTHGTVNLSFVSTGSRASLIVVDQLGTVVQQEQINTVAGENIYKLNLPATKGLYVIRLSTGNATLLRKVVVE